MQDSIPQKRCTKCENFFPATPQYFHRQANGLRPDCKRCRVQKKANPRKGGRPRKEKLPKPPKLPKQKICTKCGEADPDKFYWVMQRGKRTQRSICKRCDIKDKRQQQKDKPEAYQARQKRWNETHPEYKRNWTYGLSEQEYWQMFVTQNNACKICKRPFTEKRKPHIDHDHQTGKVRGLLCPRCNHGLGCFEDDTDLLHEAIRYLGQ